MTQQGKKKKKNANLNLIQDYIHKNARREKINVRRQFKQNFILINIKTKVIIEKCTQN
jgi:hypothetical protein